MELFNSNTLLGTNVRKKVKPDEVDRRPLGVASSASATPSVSSHVPRCMHPHDHVDLDTLSLGIAPSISGHSQIKKGLLLMLLGAVSKRSCSGDWSSRGTIHVCLLGDPSTAKSSFLKWISSTFPQAVYVSGASASVPGLTAAVLGNEDRAIAPGALVQASGSLCCIDNFEQLNDAGKHAIGAVMDQQSITITKAGIHTKLQANTSVLVASLPNGNSYDVHRPLRANLKMSESTLQCFDLLFVLKDSCNGDDDEEIANHIIGMATGTACHRSSGMPVAELRSYISAARRIQPVTSEEASCHLKRCYIQMRSAGKTSPRQLESLIRLSEAVARAHMQEIVSTEHVQEAFELLGVASHTEEKQHIDSAISGKRARCMGA